ncbi:MAG: hypothetical protein Q6K99_04775 [Thermostichales cyanobacterium BF4_bins_65]
MPPTMGAGEDIQGWHGRIALPLVVPALCSFHLGYRRRRQEPSLDSLLGGLPPWSGWYLPWPWLC